MSDKEAVSKEDEKEPETKKEGSIWSFIGTIVFAIVLVIVVQAFLVRPFKIPSESMLPGLREGDRILVDRLTPRFSEWKRGDVVVFHPPEGVDSGAGCGVKREIAKACSVAQNKKSKTYFVKRIVALPGDTFYVKQGIPYVNGKAFMVKKYVASKDCSICNLPKPIKIPKNHYMMMGDNRGNSLDSRVWGSVPKKWITGKVFLKYWPLNRIGKTS